MRAKLQSLITYTGLSIGEAASVCGVGHDALSKKLRGVPRYKARPAEIAALGAVADAQDRAVAAALRHIDGLIAEHGAPYRIALMLYRHDDDLPAGDEPRLASVQRIIAARVARARPEAVHLVMFDRAAYDAWRGAMPDTRSARAQWAAEADVEGRDTPVTARALYSRSGETAPKPKKSSNKNNDLRG